MRSGLAACVLAIGALIGPGSAGAQTLHSAVQFTGDCRSDCGGARGIGAGVGGGFGSSVALSADGRTLLAGAPGVHGGDGAALVFARRRGGWRQQGLPLTGICPVDCTPGGPATHDDGLGFGLAVALSAHGDTALVGAPQSGRGLAWVFVRRRGRWVHQGPPLLGFCSPRRRVCRGPNGTGNTGYEFGGSVALSADGNTAVIGQSAGVGGVWVFVRSGERWSQQGVLTASCQPAQAVCTGPNGTGETRSSASRHAREPPTTPACVRGWRIRRAIELAELAAGSRLSRMAIVRAVGPGRMCSSQAERERRTALRY